MYQNALCIVVPDEGVWGTADLDLLQRALDCVMPAGSALSPLITDQKNALAVQVEGRLRPAVDLILAGANSRVQYEFILGESAL